MKLPRLVATELPISDAVELSNTVTKTRCFLHREWDYEFEWKFRPDSDRVWLCCKRTWRGKSDNDH